MFSSVIDSTENLAVSSGILCMATSLILGLAVAIIHMKGGKYSKNFIITLVILPLLVQTIIMMVNGNLGSSVAIFGAFSLMKFRSFPGTSRELLSIFHAMAVGLATGMGQIFYAFIFTVLIGIVILFLEKLKFGSKDSNKTLKITIPENLNYKDGFKDLFDKYTMSNSLIKVKTTNMGSLFELTYIVGLKDEINEKDFIDEIRCRNANLNVILDLEEHTGAEL
ncbi:MAG: DUF4956 domain-containing protein [Bacilli bacterium]